MTLALLNASGLRGSTEALDSVPGSTGSVGDDDSSEQAMIKADERPSKGRKYFFMKFLIKIVKHSIYNLTKISKKKK
jgi:hypothetical protein